MQAQKFHGRNLASLQRSRMDAGRFGNAAFVVGQE
jgi:hypothetical protein